MTGPQNPIGPDRTDEVLGLYGFGIEYNHLSILQECDFSLRRNHAYLVAGADESHDLFLLKAMAGLLPHLYTRGQMRFGPLNIYEANERELDTLRKKMSYVFAEGTLISNLTVEENLLLPLRYHFPLMDKPAVSVRIKDYFDFFKIPDVLAQRPASLSYSIRKKITLVRTALLEPELILMDKPFFNLDRLSQEQVFEFLEDLKRKGVTLVLLSPTTNPLGTLIDQTLYLEEGQLHMIASKV